MLRARELYAEHIAPAAAGVGVGRRLADQIERVVRSLRSD
jgi:hypothetical protein